MGLAVRRGDKLAARRDDGLAARRDDRLVTRRGDERDRRIRRCWTRGGRRREAETRSGERGNEDKDRRGTKHTLTSVRRMKTGVSSRVRPTLSLIWLVIRGCA
jgi:hypothetical protein